VGYKVHLTETCDEETPNIITNVQTECATFNDNYSLPKIQEQLSQAELLPDKHLVDAGYIEASNLVESRREYDIELIGPAQSNSRWQQVD
jgi:transposase